MEPMCDHNGEACENIEHSMRSNTHSVYYTHYTFIRTSHVYDAVSDVVESRMH